LFESKEAIEEAQNTPAPVETPDVSEATEEQQIPKVTAPTPEQIIAIKVQLHVPYTSCSIQNEQIICVFSFTCFKPLTHYFTTCPTQHIYDDIGNFCIKN